MDSLNLIESFSEFKEFKNIDRVTMMNVLEDVFRSMLRKKYGTDEHIDIIINFWPLFKISIDFVHLPKYRNC